LDDRIGRDRDQHLVISALHSGTHVGAMRAGDNLGARIHDRGELRGLW
jgi:hypothetical protein